MRRWLLLKKLSDRRPPKMFLEPVGTTLLPPLCLDCVNGYHEELSPQPCSCVCHGKGAIDYVQFIRERIGLS